MKVTTSSRNYNYLALRGAPVDDMEFVEQFQLDKSVAYTPKINEAMLDITYNQNLEAGVDEETAKMNKMNAEKDIKELLAKNGLLK